MYKNVRRTVRRILPDPVATFLKQNRPRIAALGAKPVGRVADQSNDAARGGSRSGADVTAAAGGSDIAQRAAALDETNPSDVVAAVRELLADKKPAVAMALAAALDGRNGELAAGIVAGVRGYDDRAWSLLKDQPPQVWSAQAPGEYARAGLACDRDQAVAAMWKLAKRPPANLPARSWLEILGPVYAYGEADLAKALFERLDAAVGDGSGIDGDVRWPRDWMRDWVDKPRTAPSKARIEGTTASFAILDYRHPDRFRASANIGDHVQSLAALSHVVRHQNLEFRGPDDLVDLATRLQDRVRPEIQRTDASGTVELHLAQRDASNHDSFPEDTWAIGFGWYMHPQFGLHFDFPFHPNLRPIFVSFHVGGRQMISPEAVEYLKKYGPIGCRDWTTVDLLLSAGVDAFFSGCLTTTVSNLFPDTDVKPGPDAPTAYIDVPANTVPKGAVTAGQARDKVRLTPFATNVDFAVGMLETYRRKYAAITSSRLHVYLPARSVGVKVNFTPANMSDPRFAGLAPLDDAGFDAIREGINAKLEQVLSAALTGAPVDEVYRRWRELTAEDVAAAKDRLARPVEMSNSVSALADAVPADAPALPEGLSDDTIHVAIRAASAHPRLVRVLLSSIAEHTSRTVHARIITHAPRSFDADQLQRSAPGVRVSVVDSSNFGVDLLLPDGSRHSEQEIDRLVTLDLFPGVDRLIVLPVGAVVTADLAELADLDLGDRVVGAVPAIGRHTSGYSVLLAAARRLREQVDRSAEFRRIMHQRHAFDFNRFETDLLVVDTSRWRDGGHLRNCVRLVEDFGLTYREALHAEFGPRTAPVPSRWHVVPTQAGATDTALVHWAEKPYPWGKDPAPLKDVWQGAHATMAARDRAPVS